jgi:2,3-diketo-5-methylthiopentyl-1-phosphate enolase
MLPYFDLPFDQPESVADGAYVIATYLAYGLDEAAALKRAGNFATGQTVGTWLPLPGVTRSMVEEYQARVVGCYPAGGGAEPVFLLRVAFPHHNFGGSFAQLITALLGNDVSTAIRIKLIDLEWTAAARAAIAGPAQGMAGLRERTGVRGRPLVMNMIKPCIGFSPAAGAELFYESGSGGVDLIKDDELLGNTGFSPVAERVRAYLKAAARLREEQGKAPLYIVNITDRPDRMRDNARAARDEGARAVMVNFVAAGLDALAALTEEFGRDLFFLGHYAGAGIMNAPAQGISAPLLLGKLPRLAGADGVVTMYPGSGIGTAQLEYYQTVQAQRLPMGGLRPVVTAVGGGVTPLNVASIYRELGPDVILAVGGAIQGHPLGTAAGGRAMMQAVAAAVAGTAPEEAAAGCPELRAALEAWG